MPCIYLLKLRCRSDNTFYYKLGYLSNGDAPSRMHYCDHTNVPLTTYFDLVGCYQKDAVNAYALEQELHRKIRNEWKWKCDGAMGIHRKHKFFPKLFSGVTECRVYDKTEIKAIVEYITQNIKECAHEG